MAYLLASVLLGGYIFVLFRVLKRFRVHLPWVIALNYLVCLGVGQFFQPAYVQAILSPPYDWWYLATFTGIVFILMFNLIGYGSQEIGVGYTAVITKLSVVIPTLVSYWVFQEAMSGARWVGMVVALVAVFFLNWEKLPFAKQPPTAAPPASRTEGVKAVLVGALLFLGSGLVDTLLKLYDQYYGASVTFDQFLTTVFGVAGVLGVASVITRGAIRDSRQLLRQVTSYRALIAALVLGIPNYFTLQTMLAGLKTVEGTVFFPINNIGQLVVATAAGALLFTEPMKPVKYIGIALAVGGILLISLG